MFCNSTITDLFLFVFTQLILHYLNFWLDEVQNYTLFNHLSDAQELIQRLVIENWVSEMRSGYNNYITLSNNIQRERWVMLA